MNWKQYIAPGIMLLAALVIVPMSTRRHPFIQHPETGIRCVIALQDEPEKGLQAGLNYALLKKFSEDFDLDASIRVRRGNPADVDSVRDGAIDLLVLFWADSLADKDILTSRLYNDSTVWALPPDRGRWLKGINTWLANTTETERFRSLRASYLRGKTPSLTSISPYDDLIRRSAGELGWDWRLLSSLVYHESRFTIDANSSRGAVGLMQIRSARYSVDTLLDPVVNLSVGTRYLGYLQEMFSKVAADTTECLKFTLAAYNAGEGNILRSIRYASRAGVDTTRWEPVSSVFPQVPGFRGTQTSAYVEKVLDTYALYSRIYPE